MDFTPLVTFIGANTKLIGDNWQLFAIFGLLCAGLGYGLSSWRSAGAHEVKDERLKLAEDRVADYKDKLAGQSPEEARDALKRLQETMDTLASYGLSREGEQRLLEALKKGTGSVTISRSVDAADADRLYRQVVATFRAAGWAVDGGVIWGLSGENPDSGVTLLTWSETPAETSSAVRTALEVAGLDVTLRSNLPATDPQPRPQIVFSSRDADWHPNGRWS